MKKTLIVIVTAIATIVLAEDYILPEPVAQPTQIGIRCDMVMYDLNRRTWDVDLRKLMSDDSTEPYDNHDAKQVHQDDVYAYLNSQGITPVSTNWLQTMEIFMGAVKAIAVQQVTTATE